MGDSQHEASLEYRSRSGAPGTFTVVLFHGFGANAADLVPLSDAIDPLSRMNWYFPEAPHQIEIDGQRYGQAWFPESAEEMKEALYGNYFSRLEELDPEGLRQSAARGQALLSTLSVSPENLVLGGFSQGAMVATEMALSLETPPAALVILSGALIAEERWKRMIKQAGRFHVFQSHGTADPILNFKGARELNSLFTDSGYLGEFHPFPGGHEISSHIVTEVSNFIMDRTLG